MSKEFADPSRELKLAKNREKQQRWANKHRTEKNSRMKQYRTENAETLKERKQQERLQETDEQRRQRLEKLRVRWKANSSKHAQQYYFRKYGLTPAQRQQMFINQNFACALCHLPFRSSKTTHMDHDHTTGAVRSIICTSCNTGLGNFKDDEALLMKAIEYLRWYRRFSH